MSRGGCSSPSSRPRKRGHGTGLGLATVYGIVKQSGGHILVKSQLNVGTTIGIYLPVALGAEIQATAAPKSVPDVLRGTETVLVVEDEAALRALSERILHRYGYTVLLAADGEEAQRICASHQGCIHIALTDVALPGSSGRMVAEWITQHRPETRIIYMSGYSDNAISHQGLLDPGTTLVQKPFTPETLARTIREALS